MNKVIYIEKIFKLFNYQKSVDETDPDYGYISDLIEKIPDHRLAAFYAFLNSKNEYKDKNMNIHRGMLGKAVSDFGEKEFDLFWADNGLVDKAKELNEKISSVYAMTKNMNNEQKKHFLDTTLPSSIKFLGQNGEKILLFNDEELEVVNTIGFRDMIEMYDVEGYSNTFEEIKKHFKSLFTAKYFEHRGGVQEILTLDFDREMR